MKPPPPTTNKLPDDKRKQQYAGMIPVAVGLLAVLLFAGYTFWQQANRPPVRPPLITGPLQGYGQDYGADDGGHYGPDNEEDDNPLADLPVGKELSDLLALRQGDRVMVSEPAELPALPGGTRLGGVSRLDGHIAEDRVLWEAPAETSAEQAAAFYAEAATGLGFVEVRSAAPVTAPTGDDSGAVNRVFARASPFRGKTTAPANEVLVIRARPQHDRPVRVLLWLRYPAHPRR